MITKKTFIELIKSVQTQCIEDARISNHVNEIVRDSMPNVFSTPLVSHVVQALEAEMQDGDDTISWWLWDAPEAGANEDSAYIQFKNGDKFYLYDASDLYDYLLMELNNSTAKGVAL